VVQDVRKNHKNELASAIARGESITAWAHRNGVPLSTAFRWSQDSKVRCEVEAWRRRALDPGDHQARSRRRVRVGSAPGVAGHSCSAGIVPRSGDRSCVGWVSEAQPTKWHDLATGGLRSAYPPYEKWDEAGVWLRPPT
jgi:hypothetical protein